MSKHTPGPWRVYPTTELVDARGTEGVTGYNIESESCEIVGVEGIEFWKENAEANARLIAAAPELLEALTSLLSEAEAFASAIRAYANSEAIAAARAAIAKAKGESA
jgi:hypothetical protein